MAAAAAQCVGTGLVVAVGLLLQPARHEANHNGDFRYRLSLGQKPDRLIEPRTRPSVPAQLFNAQMVRDVSHVRIHKEAKG